MKRLFASFAVLAVVALAACSGGANAAGATGPAAISIRPIASGPVSKDAMIVPVSETEFKIGLPRTSFKAGTYTFVVRNNGRAPHSLRISGPGVAAATRTLSAGQSAKLTVTLRRGRYELDCPVDNHAALGMRRGITVT
jgi:uncharacterized cupredoxin-like copper-binding protein